VIRPLTRELNTLPQPKGFYHCPMDDDKAILLLAGYRRTKPQEVIIDTAGCGSATNGRTDRSGPSPQFGRLVEQLNELLD
jgi:hypothetical protein